MLFIWSLETPYDRFDTSAVEQQIVARILEVRSQLLSVRIQQQNRGLRGVADNLLISNLLDLSYDFGICRHYTFYIWKDFMAVHPAAKFTLVPAYLYSAWSVWWSLLQGRQPLLWVLGLAAASALTLIPAWLVDFRCCLPLFISGWLLRGLASRNCDSFTCIMSPESPCLWQEQLVIMVK